MRQFCERYSDPLPFRICHLKPVNVPVSQTVFVYSPEGPINVPITGHAQHDTRKEVHPFIQGWYARLGIARLWRFFRFLMQTRIRYPVPGFCVIEKRRANRHTEIR